MRLNRDLYLGRGLGVWAFWLHRLSGLAIALYLLMHIVVIASVVGGSSNFNEAMVFLKQPIFVLLEMGLIGAILVHGLNGLRILAFDLGYGLKRQKEIFIGLMVVAVIPEIIAFIIAWPHIVG